jgi:hypothetical protein
VEYGEWTRRMGINLWSLIFGMGSTREVFCLGNWAEGIISKSWPTSLILSQTYNRCLALSTRWTALGSNQAPLDQMQPDFLNAPDSVRRCSLMSISTGKYDIDLGNDHWLTFTLWAPDRDLNPQFADLPDDPRAGAIITHKKADGTLCGGAVWFNRKILERAFSFGGEIRRVWDVSSWEPLTCSPSLLCNCGDHGFIQRGKWVRA